MPYIKEEDKSDVRSGQTRTGGDLNFLITELFQNHFMEKGGRYQRCYARRFKK